MKSPANRPQRKQRKQPDRTNVTVPLSSEEVAWLDRVVDSTDRSRAQVIRYVMRQAGVLPPKEEVQNATKENIAI